MQKLTREMLHKLRDSLVNEIKIRQTAGKIAYVIVGMGECGLQKGAKDVFTAISEKVNALGLRGSVAVIQADMESFWDRAPVVEVILEGQKPVKYGRVTPETAQKIIESHIINKKTVTEYMLDAAEARENHV
ncbi:(2Fe-2S) ferredoxin domain-containing protein [Treponema sp. OMZ 803]|jgi:hypothetical protein|uniref:(2Fe-2S) ferredoxin domain-containing protein n=1 Tax=Treponema sp. OMZ 803 TaxID=120682 RepID=UPI0020A3680B|nr:(2Fe-2S) ferredoxin domain-containing protein [Treponema sp. OMZ 803]UTC52866.1 (2Fe-2S) ferredoxin domain-containing protein [Treponema sp. OMZ 803]